MDHRFRAAVAACYDAVIRLGCSPFFFIVFGIGLITASYSILTRVGPCQRQLLEMACLELSQLNLAYGLLATLLGVSNSIIAKPSTVGMKT